MATNEERMAAKMMGFWECPKCGMKLEGQNAGPEKSHGWVSVRNGPKPDGKGFPFVYCADATSEDVTEYREAKVKLAKRREEVERAEREQQEQQGK